LRDSWPFKQTCHTQQHRHPYRSEVQHTRQVGLQMTLHTAYPVPCKSHRCTVDRAAGRLRGLVLPNSTGGKIVGGSRRRAVEKHSGRCGAVSVKTTDQLFAQIDTYSHSPMRTQLLRKNMSGAAKSWAWTCAHQHGHVA
jgi:hypothetical protein